MAPRDPLARIMAAGCGYLAAVAVLAMIGAALA